MKTLTSGVIEENLKKIEKMIEDRKNEKIVAFEKIEVVLTIENNIIHKIKRWFNGISVKA